MVNKKSHDHRRIGTPLDPVTVTYCIMSSMMPRSGPSKTDIAFQVVAQDISSINPNNLQHAPTTEITARVTRSQDNTLAGVFTRIGQTIYNCEHQKTKPEYSMPITSTVTLSREGVNQATLQNTEETLKALAHRLQLIKNIDIQEMATAAQSMSNASKMSVYNDTKEESTPGSSPKKRRRNNEEKPLTTI